MKKENMIFRLKLEIDQLVEEILNKLPDSLFQSSTTTFLDPSMGGGQFVYAIESRLRKYGHSSQNIKRRVFGIEKTQLRINFAINKYKLNGTYTVDNNDIPNIFNSDMKFDAIIGNPPYNAPKFLKEGSEKLGGGTTLWDRFIFKSFDMLNENGYLCYVHPIGWRSFTGDYESVSDIYKKNNLIYVGMNDVNFGKKTFGASTAFDVVICQKSKYSGKTTFKDFDGNILDKDLSKMKFIPSGKFNEVDSLIANDEKETAKIIYSATAYESRKEFVSKQKTSEFKYPIIHGLNVKDIPTFLYSSRNDRGNMFGISKLIFGVWSGCILDSKGEYGCSQHTRGIAESPENLPLVEKCFKSQKFIDLMKYLNWSSVAPDKYNKDAIKHFRKDFWRDFV